MKGFDVLKIKSAVQSRNKFDLSSSHLTTMDFGQIVPLWYTETVPGDQFNVRSNFFSRMSPLVKPTYGSFSFKTVSAFCPYYQVCDEFDAFVAGKKTWQSTTPNSRYIYYTELVNFLFNYCTEGVGTGVADWNLYWTNGSLYTRKWNSFGRYAVKVLNSLGYAVPQNVNMKSDSLWYSKFGNAKLSALPLLAFAKVYNDYMSQSQKFNTSTLTYLLRCVRHNINYSGSYSSVNCSLSGVGINTILTSILLCYENDYFTSAWQRPTSPLGNVESVDFGTIPGDLSGTPGEADGSLQNNAFATTYEQYIDNRISQRSLDFLRRFDDWVRRNNYSGSKDVQQIYSRFGIKTEDYKSNYAHIIATDVMPIQVGDVTAQTPSSYGPLGDYAGKGIMNGSKGFSYKASDFGALFVFGYYTVKPLMAYGNDRAVMRVSPFDFYNPEFDGLGAEAISYGEVFCNPLADPHSNTPDSTLDDAVYGFTERYNSYRFGKDHITGSFRKFNNSDDDNTWHTGRLLNDIRRTGNMVAQSTSMVSLPQYDSEYDRIFSVTSGVDNFYLTCKFDVSAVRPMLSLNQVPRLGEGDTNVPKNGNVIN